MHISRQLLNAAVLGASLVCAGSAGAKDIYKMTTIPPGNTIYLTAASFAQAVNKYVPDTEIQVNATGSIVQHQLDAGQGKTDFFTLAMLTSHHMKAGTAMFGKVKEAPELFKNLRSIFAFNSGTFQIVVYEDSGIKSLKDLKGKRVFLGPPSGGATIFAQGLIEGATGYKAGEDFEVARMGFASAEQAFQDRKIDVWVHPSLVPDATLQQVALTSKIRLIGLEEADFEKPGVKAVMNLPGRTREVVPAGAYGKNHVNEGPVISGGAWLGVGVRKGISDELVYKATKAFWENIGDLHAQGPALKGVNLDSALRVMNIPLHPGAVRYYREVGRAIPPEFLPPEAK